MRTGPSINPRITVSVLMLLIAYVATGIYSGMLIYKSYPRPSYLARGNGRAGYWREHYEDGWIVISRYPRPGEIAQRHVINPPRPSALRVWAPAIICLTYDLLFTFVVFNFRMLRIRLRSSNGLACLLLTLLALWFSLPAARIFCSPSDDYHIHLDGSAIGGRSVHESPYFQRYFRLLFGRKWPGDYRCTLPTTISIPPPPCQVPRLDGSK